MNDACTECGQEIIGRKSNAKTCSPACHRTRHLRQMRAYESRKAEARRAARAEKDPIHCGYCSTEFVPRAKTTKFCSRVCTWGYHQKKKLGRGPSRPCSKCGVDTPTKPGVPVCDHCKVNPRPRRQEYERSRNLGMYGLSPADFDALVVKQGGRCAICGTSDPRGDGGLFKRKSLTWSVDHDHATGAVRGLLCSACNCAIGLFKEDVQAMHNAIRYVEGHRDAQAQSASAVPASAA